MGYSDITIKNGNKFLKIESGTAHDIRLLDESPRDQMVHGFGKDLSPCIGNGCEGCQAGDPAKQRFTANVYDFTLAKVMEWNFGAAIAKQLKAIDITLGEEGRKITEVDLKVEASGANMQKKYIVTPRTLSKLLPPGVIPF